MVVTSNRTRFYTRFNLTQINVFSSESQIKFPFLASHVIIANDSQNRVVTFSFNGRDIDGELFPSEGPITFDWSSDSRIWLFRDGTTGQDAQIRVWGWRL